MADFFVNADASAEAPTDPGTWQPVGGPVFFPGAENFQGTATVAKFLVEIPLPNLFNWLDGWVQGGAPEIVQAAQQNNVQALSLVVWKDVSNLNPFVQRYTLAITAAGASPVPAAVLIAMVPLAVTLAIGVFVTVNIRTIRDVLIGPPQSSAITGPGGGSGGATGGGLFGSGGGGGGLVGAIGSFAPVLLLGLIIYGVSQARSKS